MGFKMPKLSMPNLKIPNNSTKGMDRVQKFFTTHKTPSTNSVLSDAKKNLPGPLQKILPNASGKETGLDMNVSSMIKSKTFDIEGMLSKEADASSIMDQIMSKSDFGISDSMFDISKLKNMKFL